MKKSNLITKIFQNIVKNKDIREFKKSLLYYLSFRLFRNFFNNYIEINIYDFKIFASNKKNQTSHGLLKKCDFDDQSELNIIKIFSLNKNVFLLDCGCNYGFYSFYTASLSNKNSVIALEASPKTCDDFNRNLNLNNFKNIQLKNLAVSDIADNNVIFNESNNDWESSLSHNKFEQNRSTKINTTTIDKVLNNYDLKDYFLFIKLDVEGHEFHALTGGIDTIRKYNPIIIIELSKYIFENSKDSLIFFKKFLIDFGYNIYGTDNNIISLDNVIKLLDNLDKDHKTIGNYYLIKNIEKPLNK